jgi:hypothetical protein
MIGALLMLACAAVTAGTVVVYERALRVARYQVKRERAYSATRRHLDNELERQLHGAMDRHPAGRISPDLRLVTGDQPA